MDLLHYQSPAQLFRALMHPVRIAILDLLRGGPLCVCHIEARLGLRQPFISQQLAILRSAGLVRPTREGSNISYQLVQPGILALLDSAQDLLGGQHDPAGRPAVPGPSAIDAASSIGPRKGHRS
jgi:ArsR family transcriptional regulator